MSRIENILIGIFFMLCCIAVTLIFSYLNMDQFSSVEESLIRLLAFVLISPFFCLGLRYGIRGIRKDP